MLNRKLSQYVLRQIWNLVLPKRTSASRLLRSGQGGSPMIPHEEWSPRPDPEEQERQRQRVLTFRLLFVIAVLLGVITPMLLKRLFF